MDSNLTLQHLTTIILKINSIINNRNYRNIIINNNYQNKIINNNYQNRNNLKYLLPQYLKINNKSLWYKHLIPTLLHNVYLIYTLLNKLHKVINIQYHKLTNKPNNLSLIYLNNLNLLKSLKTHIFKSSIMAKTKKTCNNHNSDL